MDSLDRKLSESPKPEKITAAVSSTLVAETEQEDVESQTTHRRRVPEWFEVLWSNRKARAGLIMLAFFILVAIFANQLAPYSPNDISFGPSELPSSQHWLGTTQAGQDVLSQLIYGTRTSLLVGAFGGGIATLIALVIGMVAGYMGGIVDEILSFVINIGLVVPALPLMVTIAAYAPVKGPTIIILVIGLTGWAWGARLKRSQVLTLRVRDYITSAQFAGDGPFRIIFREVLPNMLSLTVLSYIGAAMGAIGAEAGLEFLGVGDPSTISWGVMLYWADKGGALVTGQWAWLVAPGLALAAITSCLMLINFGVDALSNPQLREE
ncbi:MAG: ABC transporter permease [Ktedonobacteraceae bacterium]|nr:ABC transporter permease [Ktedonobacteraceae bacterium]